MTDGHEVEEHTETCARGEGEYEVAQDGEPDLDRETNEDVGRGGLA